MTKISKTQVLLGALNLLTVGSPALANSAIQAATQDQKVETLNKVSFKAIESTWLKVPNACKARGFNADPISLQNKEAALPIQKLYASFGV